MTRIAASEYTSSPCRLRKTHPRSRPETPHDLGEPGCRLQEALEDVADVDALLDEPLQRERDLLIADHDGTGDRALAQGEPEVIVAAVRLDHHLPARLGPRLAVAAREPLQVRTPAAADDADDRDV